MDTHTTKQSSDHKPRHSTQYTQKTGQDIAPYNTSDLQQDLADQNPQTILYLQRTVGNAALQRLLDSGSLQRAAAKADTAHLEVKKNETVEGDPFVEGKGDKLDIHPSDAKQGMLGDCFVIASLAVVAQQNPEIIRNAISPQKRSPDNTYTVTFYRRTEPSFWDNLWGSPPQYEKVPITVKAEFPAGAYVDAKGNRYEGQDLHAATVEQVEKEGHVMVNSNEIWAAIMEKAYGQFIGGGYDKLNQGGSPYYVLEALTGKPSQLLTPQQATGEELQKIFDSGGAITLSTYGDSKKYVDSKTGLVAHHGYYVSAVDAKAGTVTVQNPHGYDTKGGITIQISDIPKYFVDIITNKLK